MQHKTNHTDSRLPVITIIVAVLNGVKNLQRCIDSVSSQTHPNMELVIVDGGSTDGTVETIKANEANLAHWQSGPDSGVYEAWNKALDHSHGEWIFFLGADDYLWGPDVIEQMIPHLLEVAPGCKIVFGRSAAVTEEGEVVTVHGLNWERVRRPFLQMMVIPHQGVFHHRDLFEVHGRFDESFRVAGDYELLLRELKNSNASHVPGVLISGKEIGGLSEDHATSVTTVKEFLRARRMNGIRSLPYLTWWVLAKAYVKQTLLRAVGTKFTRRLVDDYRAATGRPRIWSVRSKSGRKPDSEET